MNINDSLNLTKKYKQIISAVHIVYRLVNSTPNVKELSLRLTRLLCQFVHASSASIYLLAPDRKRLASIAIFNNEINIFISAGRDLRKTPVREMSVCQGNSIFEDRMMGMPLVADECVGAIIIKRKASEPAFDEFDREMFTIFAEQSVTAIRNLQFAEEQQKVILESMRLIQSLLQRQGKHYRGHSPVYFKIVKRIARHFRMGEENINSLYYTSILHNIGTVDVPYQILAKKGQLTPEEFKHIRSLPKKSAEIIRPIEFLRPIFPIVLYLHENYDGTGYPSGLKGEQIPLGARIMAVVDAFESMVQGRPYKKRLGIVAALKEIKSEAGTQFDPQVVEVFLAFAKERNFRNYLSLVRK